MAYLLKAFKILHYLGDFEHPLNIIEWEKSLENSIKRNIEKFNKFNKT